MHNNLMGSTAIALIVSIGIASTALASAETQAHQNDLANEKAVVASQPLAEALKELARKTKIQFVYLGDVQSDIITQPLFAVSDAEEALQRLLTGTALEYQFVDENTVLIKVASADTSLRGLASDSSMDTASEGVTLDDESADASSESANNQLEHNYEGESSGLVTEQIYITARKRQENLFEVPISITAFSQSNIDDLGVNTIGDLSKFTPGFEFQDVGQGGAGGRANPNIRFRGVAVQNENPASRAGAIFWDGAYISSGVGILPLFDLERVEVIRGPQNAFYGRNTFAGAVNFIPNTETEELNGRLNLNYSPSQEDSYSANGSIGMPIGDKIGLRVGGFYERVGADYQFGNGDPLGQEDTSAINYAITFEPSESLRLKATGFHVWSEDTRALQAQDFTTAPGDCNRTFTGQLRAVATGELSAPFTTDLSQSTLGTFCGEIPDWDNSGVRRTAVGDLTGDGVILNPFSGSLEFAQTLPPELQEFNFPSAPNGFGTTYRLWRTNLSAEYDLPDDHLFSILFSAGVSADHSISDQLYGQSVNGEVRLTGFQNWSQDRSVEARIASSSEKRLRYQVGVNYYANKFRGGVTPAFAGAPAFFGPQFNDNTLSLIDGENIGIFGSLDYDFTQELTVSLEGRWNKDTQTIVYAGPTMRDGDQAPGVSGEEQSFSKFMPRVLVSYQPLTELNVYGSWSLSYLQGNQTNALAYSQAVPNAGLNPETLGFFTPVQKLNAFEVGIKSQPFDRLTANFSVYYMQWDNQVQFELSPSRNALFTAGDSEYVGAELELNANPTDWLNLTGNASYVDVQLTEFAGSGSVAERVLFPGIENGQQISANGNRPRFISAWSAAVSGTVEIGELLDLERRVFFRADALYQGQFFIDNFEYNSVPGYWRANVRAGLVVNESLTLELYGNNITNDQSWITAGGTTTGDTALFGFANRRSFSLLPTLREFGIQARMTF